MSNEYECNSFKFIRFETLSGFNAFKDGESVGIDEVCSHIDSIEQQLKEVADRLSVAEKVIEFYGDAKNWGNSGNRSMNRMPYNDCNIGSFDGDGYFYKNVTVAGKTARDYLKKYRGEK